jgi:hypothetical protein
MFENLFIPALIVCALLGGFAGLAYLYHRQLDKTVAAFIAHLMTREASLQAKVKAEVDRRFNT